MSNWMKITEVLKYPEVYGDISRRGIFYYPSKQSINFEAQKTGCEKDQNIGTERSHHYFPVLHDGMAYLVSRDVTRQFIDLKGEKGYQNAIVILRKFARLFGNKQLNAEGVILDEETIGALYELPEEYRTIKDTYWTAIKHCEIFRKGPFCANYGLYLMTPKGPEHQTLYKDTENYTKIEITQRGFLRPVIRLHPDTCVNVRILRNGNPEAFLDIQLG